MRQYRKKRKKGIETEVSRISPVPHRVFPKSTVWVCRHKRFGFPQMGFPVLLGLNSHFFCSAFLVSFF